MEDLWDENILEESTPPKKVQKKDGDLKVKIFVYFLVKGVYGDIKLLLKYLQMRCKQKFFHVIFNNHPPFKSI